MGIFHCCARYTGIAISVIVDFSFTFKTTTKPLGKIQIEELCFELSRILCFKLNLHSGASAALEGFCQGWFWGKAWRCSVPWHGQSSLQGFVQEHHSLSSGKRTDSIHFSEKCLFLIRENLQKNFSFHLLSTENLFFPGRIFKN